MVCTALDLATLSVVMECAPAVERVAPASEVAHAALAQVQEAGRTLAIPHWQAVEKIDEFFESTIYVKRRSRSHSGRPWREPQIPLKSSSHRR